MPTRPKRTTPRLQRDSCSSPRAFGLGFLQTPPHDDALALLLAFGFAKTWHGDSHPKRSVPCPAHTPELTGPRVLRGQWSEWLGGLQSNIYTGGSEMFHQPVNALDVMQEMREVG